MSNHAALLSAIGRALGLPAAYEEHLGDREPAISVGTMFSPPIAEHREVCGGAVDDAGRVAWVELRSAPPVDGHVPVEIDVRFAWDGRLRGVVVPYTYNPYFGCRVVHAQWYGESFVLIYREKHRMVLSRFVPPYDAQDHVAIGDDLVIDGDRVFYLDARAQLLRGRTLPEMHETPSIHVPGADDLRIRLERPGVVRMAELPSFLDYETREAYEADVAAAFASGRIVALP